MNSGFATTVGVIYFWFISKNWLYLEIFACVLGIISFIGTLFFIPESPKFLISMKRFDEARAVISYIAKINGKPAFKD